jgi:hypothetical protein
MSRIIPVLLVGAFAMIGLALVRSQPVVAQASDCTRVGTQGDDIISGGRGNDVICLKAGKDYASGNGGADVIRGGKGRDTLVGNKGRDELYGKKGKDRIFLVNGHGGSLAHGGPGLDQCFVDDGDQIQGCEEVFRGASVQVATGLAFAFHGQGELAEELIGEPVPIPPTVTVVVPTTVTVTEPFPACEEPPATPPPFC